MALLLLCFRWLGHTTIGTILAHSTWGFPTIEMAHLLGLAVLGGEILLIDLQLLGVGSRRVPVSRLARELWPVFITGLSVMLISGVLMVSAEAMKCYYNPAFRAKMVLLLFALGVSYAIQRAVTKSNTVNASRWLKVGAVLSLLLWLSVGAAGRLIGLL
jgi:hypothetical protein